MYNSVVHFDNENDNKTKVVRDKRLFFFLNLVFLFIFFILF